MGAGSSALCECRGLTRAHEISGLYASLYRPQFLQYSTDYIFFVAPL
jgi:hypothetical protein